jgi:hypothetical protein
MHNAEMGLSDISECEWPCFLYPRGTKYDLNDDRDGLFRGYLLPMVCLICLMLTGIYAQILIFFFCRFFVRSLPAQGRRCNQELEERVVQVSHACTI